MTTNNDNTAINSQADVITVKATFLKAKLTFRFLLSKWIIILTGGIIGAAIGLYVAYTTKPTYTGTLNFVLSTGSKTSNFSGLASQLGIDIGGSTGDVFSGDNIITLFKSKRMIKSVLFKRPPDSTDVLANIIVREWGWDKGWKKKERTKNLFPFPQDGNKLNPLQDSLVRSMYNYILKKQLTISRSDPKLSTYTLTTTSTNEAFACYMTKYLMDETANFYINTKTATAKQAVQLLQKEADSLRGQLSGSIVSNAAEADRTFALNPAMQVQRAPAAKGQVRTAVLGTAYAEIMRNLELAKISLQRESPLYQIIDTPEMPLEMKKLGRLLALIAGGIVGGILTVLFLLGSRMLKSLNS